ncbi:unnamed protein product, partial [Mesorhabditis belari]|uniref:RRM domain-containing protein n=1 Tax=Mesorhabditis belari TaxID=2138241 RepID=A0AAF3J4X3_9BILA
MYLNEDNSNLLGKIKEYVGDRKYRLDCQADGCKSTNKGFRPPFFLEHVILKHHPEFPKNYKCTECHGSFFGVVEAACHGLSHKGIVTCNIQETVQDFRQLNVPERRKQGQIWEAAYYTYNISIVHDAVKRLIDDGFLQYGPTLQEMRASADAGAVEIASLNFESISHNDEARVMERQNGKRRMNDEEYQDNREFSKSQRTENNTYDQAFTSFSRSEKKNVDDGSFNNYSLPNQHQMDYRRCGGSRHSLEPSQDKMSPQKIMHNEMNLSLSRGTWSETPSEIRPRQMNYTSVDESLRRQRFQEMRKADNLQKGSFNEKAKKPSTSRKTPPQQKQKEQRRSGTVRVPPVREKIMDFSSSSPPKTPRGHRFNPDPDRSPVLPVLHTLVLMKTTKNQFFLLALLQLNKQAVLEIGRGKMNMCERSRSRDRRVSRFDSTISIERRRDHNDSRSRRRDDSREGDHLREQSPRRISGEIFRSSAARAIEFTGAPFTDAQLNDVPKKQFTGRGRLYIGNLPPDMNEKELRELFNPYGHLADCYLSGKGFAFIRMDTRAHAESAKEAIDGLEIKGRQVRVRYSIHGAALRIKELPQSVSNEWLYHTFSQFGEVERAIHIVDEKGRATGEGIVEFERKPAANEALAWVRDKVFLIAATPRPLVAELVEPKDEEDGLAERLVSKVPKVIKERALGPRFPVAQSFEYFYGMKWKELYEAEKRRRAQLEDELKATRERLDRDMAIAYQHFQTNALREELERRQKKLERLEATRRDRITMSRNERNENVFGGVFGLTQPSSYVQMESPSLVSGSNTYRGNFMPVTPTNRKSFESTNLPFSPVQTQTDYSAPTTRRSVLDGVQQLLSKVKSGNFGVKEKPELQENVQGTSYLQGAFGDSRTFDAFDGMGPPIKKDCR